MTMMSGDKNIISLKAAKIAAFVFMGFSCQNQMTRQEIHFRN